jgi:hypothetical protein
MEPMPTAFKVVRGFMHYRVTLGEVQEAAAELQLCQMAGTSMIMEEIMIMIGDPPNDPTTPV